MVSNDTDSGGASDTSKDRVTKYEYLGPTSLVTQLIAMDAHGDGNTADNQVTRYVYAVELQDHPDPLRDYLRDRETETIEIEFKPGETDTHDIEEQLEALYETWKDKEVELFEKHFGEDLELMTERWRLYISGLRAR